VSKEKRLRMPPAQKVEWRVVAVTDEDPSIFALDLEESLQELTDDGFTIVSQMQRDGALIITAQKAQLDTPPGQLNLPPGLRSIISEPPRSGGKLTREVLYHSCGPEGPLPQRRFETMAEALRVVQQDIREDVVPVSLVAVEMVRFEQDALPSLFKSFAAEMKAEKPKD